MYYQVSKEFFDKLPNACFGAVAVRGLDNTHEIPELEQMLAENVAACETYFAGKKPKETEDILPYRAAFTSLGINPNKFLCSIEALLTRIAKGKGFPHITAAVDLGNAKVLNIIMLGVYVGYTQVVPADVVWNTIEHKLGKKPALLPLNRQAFELGLKLGAEQR